MADTCAGCGATADMHPWVGIARTGNGHGPFVAEPICDDCHRDPLHRTTPLKMHFHARANSTVAVVMANHFAQRPAGADLSLG